jgi:NADPH2:quinone reductase
MTDRTTASSTMRAMLCRAFGPVSSLRLEAVPAPVPGPGEVVIAVRACGINFFDGLMVEGKYQTKPPFPFSPGSEVAGVVRAVGEGVGTFAPGMRVFAFVGHGGMAEQVVADARNVSAMPATLDEVTAAAFPVVYGTSLHALKDRGQLQSGETLLVLGAAGGVGLAAVELGKLMGARVIAAASSLEKLELCRRYGADEVIDYTAGDLRVRVKEITGADGVDVVYDPVGGAATEPMIRSLAMGGRYLVIGFAAGEIPKIPLNLLLLKSAAAVGVFWGAFTKAHPAENAANIRQLLDWLVQGRLRPHIHATYPLERAVEAITVVMNRQVQGKAVVTVP